MVRNHVKFCVCAIQIFPLVLYFALLTPSNGQRPVLQKYFNIFATPLNQIGDDTRQNYRSQFGPYDSNFSSIASKCAPTSMFASFNPSHRSAVDELEGLLRERTDVQTFLDFSDYCKSRSEVHPQVWYSAFVKALARGQPDLLNLRRPNSFSLFPTLFFPDGAVRRDQGGGTVNRGKRNVPVRHSHNQQQGQGQSGQQCFLVDERVGTNNGAENALWYFRQDVMLNGHHMIWHLLFPIVSEKPMARRGEFFYFFHHDLLARYTSERLSNGFADYIITPLSPNYNDELAEGYDSHLRDGVSTQFWIPRPARTPMNENTLNNDMVTRLINLTEFWKRVVELILTGTININGKKMPLTHEDNVNIVGELFEASVWSANSDYYGQLGWHNDAHWVIGSVLNNHFRPGTFGIMASTATSLRDIVFYRLHKAVDNMFATYKAMALPPYQITGGDHPLLFPGVQVTSVSLQIETTLSPPLSQGEQPVPNQLRTFWNMRRFQTEGGLDFNPNMTRNAPFVDACVKHLDHDEFVYSIDVNNHHRSPVPVFVRIYMAPKYKPGLVERFTFEDQMPLFFSMDAFVDILQPGRNIITRHSLNSSLTAEWPESIPDIRDDINAGNEERVNCECGFPHHLLLPKGLPVTGMPFDLFVMLTDANQDYISPATDSASSSTSSQCVPSYIHCGIMTQAYPDKKPMGYPFDRKPLTVPIFHNNGHGQQPTVVGHAPPTGIEDWVALAPNMATTQVTITHHDVQIGRI